MRKASALTKRLSLNVLSPKATAASPTKASPGTPATRDTDTRLRLSQPPVEENQATPPVSPRGEAPDDVSAVIDEIQATLEHLIQRMDAIKPAKLRSIKLGGELRGLLGKAEDEFGAHEATFHKHAHNDGLQIQLQNFVASLHGLEPVLDSIEKTKFMVNTFVKRNVEFAFQEINSYYASIFTELSLAVAHASGSAAEAAILAAMQKPSEPESTSDEASPEMQYQTAQKYFFGHGRATNHHQAFIHYKLAASQGHMEAMSCLAQYYRDGKVVESDTEAAILWSTKAAALGSIEATFTLGDLLVQKARLITHPTRCQEAFALAMVRLTQAGNQGHREAQFAVGQLYATGALSSVNWPLAKEWYLKASGQGHSKADEALGLLYFYGNGVDADKAQAAHYFQLATHSDPTLSDAWYHLGLIYSNGDEVPVDKPRAQRSFLKAAQLQHSAAPLKLAPMLLASDCTSEALKWLLHVNPPTSESEYLLGTLFEHDEFCHVPTALRHYTAAAKEGHGPAALRAAHLYYSGAKGCDVRSDKRLALEMYHVAATRAKDPEAMNALGLMYEDGEGCAVDLERAATWFREAASRGSAHGHFNLACLLRAGRGVEKDCDAAKVHFQQAFHRGIAQPKECRYVQAQQYLATTR
ncbi:hypothetical protein ACHHYP_10235 [Achlya hypogyna]|uniref:Uncharacterized protein n=1 Tax=Achlya hypogyna TaxID=1202772 RepID=A0A1V9YLY1_ACHHY|nr:hypothetical protein ACHHYP_10235 [Achlya hypogyna]